MKRNPRKIVDSTLQFAARRNVPVRYNREHIATTIEAMKRITEIRARRERQFYKRRMAGNKVRQRELDRKLVEENQHLLPRERASERLAREAEEEIKEAEELGVEAMDTTITAPITKRQRTRQKLLVGGGVEESMDVD
ncbi:MAG: hypothetical protein LQ340_005679 [Diploschistes diacapsis]|nr:MAG: hypothetical protein LQ340_005679 [Diploschistes diacapsis]